MAYRRKKKRRSSRHRTCVRYKRVRVRGQGYARRCVKYRGRGKRPFNKGRKCVQRYANGKCRSYGARPRQGRARMHGPMRNTGAYYSNRERMPAVAMGIPSWFVT